MVESRWVSSFLNSFLWDPRRAIHGVRWFIWNGVAFGLIVAKNRNKITRQILALYATSVSSGTERAQKHKHTCFLEAKQAINSELQPIGSAENETSMNLLHYPSCVRPPIFVISSSPSKSPVPTAAETTSPESPSPLMSWMRYPDGGMKYINYKFLSETQTLYF